jgi:pyruvate dehydrogenase E2 component (dihydrolipoamide acetyltransferase)
MSEKTHEVILPKFGRMQEARITEWFREEGDSIKEGEPLFAIETDKASQEIESEVSGELIEIRVPGGEEAQVGEVLAVIREVALEETTEESRGADEASEAPAGLQAIRKIPLTDMRRAIASRMRMSLQESAQLTLTTEADVTASARKMTEDISVTAVIVQVVARTLLDHPLLNSSLSGEEIHVWDKRNIGVAVNIEGSGLIVPVIPRAEEKTVSKISSEVAEMAERARQGEITESELGHGTFTVTNLGMFGVDSFTPILNPPEVGILGVGRWLKKAVWVQDDLAARMMATLSLTIDHRVVDGGPGANFLRDVAARLEQADFF